MSFDGTQGYAYNGVDYWPIHYLGSLLLDELVEEHADLRDLAVPIAYCSVFREPTTDPRSLALCDGIDGAMLVKSFMRSVDPVDRACARLESGYLASRHFLKP